VVTASVATLCLTPIAAVPGLALPAAAAAADVYQQVLQTYERAGTIPACRFTAGQLQTALNGIDTYGAQYFADFTQAIQAALAARAGGECSVAPARSATAATSAVPPQPGTSGAPGHPGAPGGAGSNTVAPLPAATAATSAGLPVALIVLAALAVGLTLAGGLTAGARALSARRHRITEPPQP
jgi:hypothetical protein